MIYKAPVVRIEQDAGGVRVVCRREGAHQTFSADYLICALPFSVLREVEISPPFSAKTRAIVAEMTYGSVSRVFLQMKTRTWETQGWNGFAVTDDPMEVWHPTHNQPGLRGILVAYACHGYARRLAAMPEPVRLSHTLDRMERLFPGARPTYETGTSHCWDDDPWTRGAWAEQSHWWGLSPEGRIHLAGDCVSSHSSWMQGAFESAWRVAHEINDIGTG